MLAPARDHGPGREVEPDQGPALQGGVRAEEFEQDEAGGLGPVGFIMLDHPVFASLPILEEELGLGRQAGYLVIGFQGHRGFVSADAGRTCRLRRPGKL